MKLKAFWHIILYITPKKLIKKLNIRRVRGQKAALFPGPKNRVFRAVFFGPENRPIFGGPEIRALFSRFWNLASFLVVLKNDHPAASDRHNPRNGILPVFRISLKFPFLYLPLKTAI